MAASLSPDASRHPHARAWREAFARLSAQTAPCPGFKAAAWPTVHTVALQFLSEHADRAAALGWTAEELFGVHPVVGAVRVDACGALMLSGGKPVIEVTPERISFEASSYYRAPGAPPSVPVWGYREPARKGR